MSNKVFVYGTLQKGNKRRGLDQFGPHAEFVGEAYTTEGQFNMYDMGPFPGVILGGANDVVGQVWDVTDEAFQQLDYIEGYPDFYNRRVTETTLGPAWMYYLKDRYDADMVPSLLGKLQWKETVT